MIFDWGVYVFFEDFCLILLGEYVIVILFLGFFFVFLVKFCCRFLWFWGVWGSFFFGLGLCRSCRYVITFFRFRVVCEDGLCFGGWEVYFSE